MTTSMQQQEIGQTFVGRLMEEGPLKAFADTNWGLPEPLPPPDLHRMQTLLHIKA